MNLIRYRRNQIIIIGMILLNIATQVYIFTKGCDTILIISYFILNAIWIFLILKATNEIVRAVDEYIK